MKRHRPSRSHWTALPGLLVALLAAAPAAALEVQVLLDVGNTPATGCTVATGDGPFAGVEQILTTRVDAGTAQVTDVVRQVCTDPATDTFGPEIPVAAPFAPPWPVGIGNGVAGGDVVETYISRADLALPIGAPVVRVGFTAQPGGGGDDALLTTNGLPGGAPIIIVLAQSVLEIPTLSEWALGLFALLLAAAAALVLRRRRRSVAAALGSVAVFGLALGIAWAAVQPDGLADDWLPSQQIATDPLGDAPPSEDIAAAFGAATADTLCLRVDLFTNSPPVAQDDDVATDEDMALSGDVLADNGNGPDSDPDGDPLSVNTTPVSGPANGALTLDADGTFTYTPAADFNGADAFEYELQDDKGATDVGLVTITVSPVDDLPTAVDDAATVAEDDPATAIDVLANDTDADGGPKAIASASDPANGTVVVTGGGTGLTYQPDPGYCNDPPGTTPDTFTYTLTPGGSTATVSVTVTCVDDPPTAVDDSATVLEDAAATAIDVLANDTDPDGGPKSIASVSDPANGTVVETGGGTGLTYQPDPNYCNDPPGTTPDTFTYTLTPGGSTATVSLTVTCANDPPALSSPHMAAFTEAAGAVAVAPTITVSDADNANLATATVTLTNAVDGAAEQLGATACGGLTVTGAGTATLSISGAAPPATYQTCLRSVTYNHISNAPTESPARTITLVVNDGAADSNTATSTVTVTGVPSPPMIGTDPIAYTTAGNTQLKGGSGAMATAVAYVEDAANIPTKASIADPDTPAGSLTYSLSSGPSNGTATVSAAGNFLYSPNPGFVGADSFTYEVSDGVNMPTGTVNVTVTDTDGAVAGDQVIWYVENDAAAGGDGTSAAPFDTLKDAESGGGASGPGDTIFVLEGDGTTAKQNAGLVLAGEQKLIGHRAATLSANGVTIQTPSAGGRPKIEHTAGDGVTVLADAGNGDRGGIEIRGLDIAGDDNAVDVSAADANNLDVALSDNLLTSTNGASLVVDGSGSTGTAVVRELDATSVLTSGAGGGLVFESVTFDADVVTAGIQPVAAGDVNVGNPASPGDVTGHGVRLNNVRGTLDFGTLNIGNSGGVGLFVRDADGKAGTFVLDTDGGTISTINGPALDLDPVGLGLGGMDGMVLTSVTANVTAGAVPYGINLHTVAGSFQVTGATSISAGGIGTLTTGIAATDATAAITFTGTTTVSTTTGAGIALSNVDGPVTVASLMSSVTGAAGAAIDIDQGLGDFTYNGSIVNTAGRSVEITNHEGPGGGSTVSLTGSITDSGTGVLLDNNDQGAGGTTVNLTGSLNLTTGGSNAFTATNGGVVNVTDPANNNLAATTTGTGVLIDGTSIGASGVKFTTVNVSGAANGILLTNVPSGSFTATGGAIQNVTNRGLDVQGGSGNVTVGASLSTTATGRSLEVTGKMGGTVVVSGAIDDNGLGVNLASNAGATITITGSMDIDTVGANTGFNATGGGTVNVTTGTNDVDTSAGTGTAVNIADTAIGASGVTLRSVSADGGGTSTSAGIILDDTGTGAFTVTGTGTTDGSGGTVRAMLEDGIRLFNTDGPVSISNMVIEDIGDMASAAPGHHGVDGQQVDGGLTLDNVTIQRVTDSAIHGEAPGGGSTTWNGLTLTDSTLAFSNRFHVPGVADGGATDEAMVTIEGISGTVSITGNDFDDGPGFVNLFTASSGAVTITVQSNTFDDGRKDLAGVPSVGSSGVRVNTTGTIDADIRIGDPAETNPVLGNTFTDPGTDASVFISGFSAADVANVDLVISRNTVTITDHTSPPGLCLNLASCAFDFPNGGIGVESRGSGTFEAVISRNTLTETQNSGGLSTGSLRVDVSGDDTEVIVRNNTLVRSWDGPLFIRADGNGARGFLLIQDNVYQGGPIGVSGSGDDLDTLGLANSPSPFLPNRFQVRGGAILDLTVINDDMVSHDTASNPQFDSLDMRINGDPGTTSSTFNVLIQNTEAPEDFLLRNDDSGGAGAMDSEFNLARGLSSDAAATDITDVQAESVLDDNNNTTGGGASNANVPFAGVNIVTTTPTLPVVFNSP